MKKLHKQNKTTIAVILTLIGFTVIIVEPSNAYASENCNSGWGRCRGDEYYDNSALTGNKFSLTVSDLQTSACPNNYFAATQHWVLFPNGDFIEMGVAQGKINGVCYSSENRYLAYQQGTSYTESKLGSASIGGTQTFEISDTSGNTHWDLYNNGVNYGYLLMQTSTGSSVQVGEEATDPSTTIPSTHEGSIQKRISSWADWNSETGEHTTWPLSNWIKQCTPTYNHIHVGISSTQGCTP
ncbi:MAG: hypothetical protein ACYDAJ_08040 [Nitrosotalea sp.]